MMHPVKLISILSHVGALAAISLPQENLGFSGEEGGMEILREMSRRGIWHPVGMKNLPFDSLKRKDLDGEEKRKETCAECMAKVLKVVSRSCLC